MPFRLKVPVFTVFFLCTCLSTATAQLDAYDVWADHSGSTTYTANDGTVVTKRCREVAGNASQILNPRNAPDLR